MKPKHENTEFKTMPGSERVLPIIDLKNCKTAKAIEKKLLRETHQRRLK